MPRLEGTAVASERKHGRESEAPRKRMPLEERAKIFIPFEPLKGFREALAEREREARERWGEVDGTGIPGTGVPRGRNN